MSPITVRKMRNLLRLRNRRLVLEFCPEPTDTFGAGAWIPAQPITEEIVLFITFQAEAKNFVIEMAEFLGGLHPFRQSFGQSVALTPLDTDAVEMCDGIPADVALGVK